MTAEQLAEHMREAVTNEFGDQWGLPHEYFRYDVLIIQQDGTQIPRSPRVCANDEGRDAIVAVLADSAHMPAEPYKDWTLGYELGGPFKETDQVWWIKADGKKANVGQMLEHFTHGYPWEFALKAALAELA